MKEETINPQSTQANSQSSELKRDEDLKQCQLELGEWKDRCLRVTAEFENYKKREVRERQQWERIAQQEVIIPLLSIIDNFERARLQQQSAPAEAQAWLEGVALIAKDLEKFLEKVGVKSIEEVQQFDPEVHEAVLQVKDSGKVSGAIVSVFEKGYRFKGNVIRPARVSVAE